MRVSESRLLLVAVVTGALVAIPLACGGGDASPGIDPDLGVGPADPDTITPAGGDDSHAAGDTHFTTSVGGDSGGSPAGGDSLAGPLGGDNGPVDSGGDPGELPPPGQGCSGNLTCDTISNNLAFCSDNGTVPEGINCSANGLDDCSDGQLCLPEPGGAVSYCVDMCDSPPCPDTTSCQAVGNAHVFTLCLGDQGAIPTDAIACDPSGNCPVDYSCFTVNDADGTQVNTCVKYCFLPGAEND